MGLKAATLYVVDLDAVTPMAVFRLVDGDIVVERSFLVRPRLMIGREARGIRTKSG